MTIPKNLLPYVAIADMIGASFGKKCEAVIHDLTNPENSVVYVANGIITNREIGQSFDHLVTQVILSKNFKNDYRANYTFTTIDGREIKSSTSLIRDEKENVIGAFCINIDVDCFKNMSIFLKDFFYKEELKEQKIQNKNDCETVEEIINKLIDNIIGTVNITNLKKNDNIRLITFMYEKGIFLTKGSVDKVAKKLNISPVTVYAYLDKIKKAQKN